MADRIKAKMDFGDFDERITRLAGAGRVSLARRMALAGGRPPYTEAKIRARESHAKTSWVPNPAGPSQSSQEPGTLSDAIYLAFNKKSSTDTLAVYSISWNNTLAWWGRLREFGYFQEYRIWKDEQGMYHTDKTHPLPEPIWRPAVPFLAPAFDATLAQMRDAMLAEGRKELPKILNGDVGG